MSAFTGWHKHLPPQVEVGYVQLPGRDSRRRESHPPSFPSLIQALADGLGWNHGIPVAFFGHSMGALIGFELARELRRRALPVPVHLFVSAHRAPHLRVLNVGECPLHRLPDSVFIREIEHRYGAPPDFVQCSELIELFLPLLRADLALCETYVYTPEEPLACSISAFGGVDDPRVKKHHLEAWQAHTTHAFDLRVFPGDHFFARSEPLLLLQVLKQQLARVVRRTPQSS